MSDSGEGAGGRLLGEGAPGVAADDFDRQLQAQTEPAPSFHRYQNGPLAMRHGPPLWYATGDRLIR